MAESEEELKSLLMKVKEESEKSGFKLNIKKLRSWHLVYHFMANRWGKVEMVRDFIFLDFKITAGGDDSQEIEMLTPWKKSYDKPKQCNKKQRHHFADKSPSGQSYRFSRSHVQM